MRIKNAYSLITSVSKRGMSIFCQLCMILQLDSTEKKKPLVIHFYNKNKVGVDVFDQMARLYTKHVSKRGMSIFCQLCMILLLDFTEKKKPLVIHFYNKNKVGVDVFDQMVRLYTKHMQQLEDGQWLYGLTF